MIIEFIGIPGCGKTYLSAHFLSRIKGFDIVESIRNRFLYKAYYKIIKITLLQRKKYVVLHKKIDEALKRYYDVQAKYNDVDASYYTNVLVFNKYLYDRYAYKRKLYLMSEGILQELVNLFVNYDVSCDDLGHIFNLLEVSVKAVFIENTVENSFENVKKRNRHECYIDELTDDKMIEFLTKYKYGCEMVVAEFPVIKVDRSSDINENTDTIIHYFGVNNGR